jgi:DNA-binding GntR family transcriptional regulator
VVLSELRPGKRSLAELSRTLEVCGTSPDQIRAAVGRLVQRGLVDALPMVRPSTVS